MLIKKLNAAIKDEDISEQIRIAELIVSNKIRYPISLLKKSRDILTLYSSRHSTQADVGPDFLYLVDKNRILDIDYYSSQVGIVFSTLKDALSHYDTVGWQDGLNPSNQFSTNFYLSSNPDVRKCKINPLMHYLNQGLREGRVPLPPVMTSESELQKSLDNQHIGWHASQLPLSYLNIRIIAFYLPQFHVIEENNKWWGDGFTEWANVRKAKPLFNGHRQPKSPGELGYYDLSNVEILKRQSKIASCYGVNGFCFYFYWFAGKTLLEKPLKILQDNPDIAIDFCLCWANENWTRAWDGLEKDILLEQKHSAEDDIKFISHIKSYLIDPRYIRYENKPLIVVYRPSLLPDPRETASRWRKWCLDNGIGDIIIALTESFEAIDPKTIGFDLAIEFAPNNMNLRKMDPSSLNLSRDFEGMIYDWTSLVERSSPYIRKDYPILRCVNPGWDNSPRKGNRANILVNNSPRKFLELTENAIKDTIEQVRSPNIVFVNAWNEWAEGAILEPTAQRGYAFLDALRQAKANCSSILKIWGSAGTSSPRLALSVHAFYPELIPEIIDPWVAIRGKSHKDLIIITTPPNKTNECRAMVEKLKLCNSVVISTENRGRDIRPFLQSLDLLIRSDIDFVCKVHTKKSTHRLDGEMWRKQIFDSLFHPKTWRLFHDFTITEQNNIGLLGPSDHMLPIGTYWGSNEKNVLSLGTRLGFSVDQIISAFFPAGSMYWARVNSLAPLLTLLDPNLFEYEHGQTDGTYAHAVERIMSLVVQKTGFNYFELDSSREAGFKEISNIAGLFEYNS